MSGDYYIRDASGYGTIECSSGSATLTVPEVLVDIIKDGTHPMLIQNLKLNTSAGVQTFGGFANYYLTAGVAHRTLGVVDIYPASDNTVTIKVHSK